MIVGALVSKLIARTEARQERLRAKANQQDAEQQSGSQKATKDPVVNTSQDKPPDESAKSTPAGAPQQAEQQTPDAEASTTTGESDDDEPRRKGHGRNGADAFTNATEVLHSLDAGVIGSSCKVCGCARITQYRDKVIIRVTGQSIFAATRNHFEQGRCRWCRSIVTADGTEEILQGIGTSYITYDGSACAMLIVMHYFAGGPFKRLEALQQGWGVPMPDANQWRIVDESDDRLAPLYKALEAHGIKNAANFSIDDTGAMIIELQRAIRKELDALVALGEPTGSVRTGVNATGVYLETEQGKTVLFFTGRHHAGEIIDRLLAHRKAGTKKLISITDAASKNFDHSHEDKLEQAVCNAHCYLKFRAVKEQFPAEYAVAGEVWT